MGLSYRGGGGGGVGCAGWVVGRCKAELLEESEQDRWKVWHGVAWCGMAWCGMAWGGMGWHGVAWGGRWLEDAESNGCTSQSGIAGRSGVG